jgi:folate-binding protein YgfZ
VALALQPGHQVLAIYGPAAAARLAQAGLPVPQDLSAGVALAHADVAFAPGGADSVLNVIRTPGLGTWGFEVAGEGGAIDQLRKALVAAGVATLDAEVAEARRIVAGEAKFGVEITPEVFPMEVGLDAMIDYGKGCYLGQEPIVRIRDRGHINRRLIGLRLTDAGVVAVGDLLETDEKPKAGRVTSAARLAGRPVALAMVHLSVPVGGLVRVRHEGQVMTGEIVAAGPLTR